MSDNPSARLSDETIEKFVTLIEAAEALGKKTSMSTPQAFRFMMQASRTFTDIMKDHAIDALGNVPPVKKAQ